MSEDLQLEALEALYVHRIQQTSTENPDKPWLSPVTECPRKFAVLGCGCDREVVPSTCMNLSCKRCAPWIAERRKFKSVFRLMEYQFYYNKSWSRKPVLYTVFTVPEHVRYLYANRKDWALLRRKVWNLLKKEFGAKFGLEATHPTGDKDPVHFHPHFNFLWKQKPGFKPFLDQDVLRRAWAKKLGVKDAVAHHQYSHRIGKIIHWTRYVCRTFPGTHKWTGPVRWFGSYPKRPKEERHYKCPKCGCRVQFIGWISANLVDDYMQLRTLRGADPPWFRDHNIMKPKVRLPREASVQI